MESKPQVTLVKFRLSTQGGLEKQTWRIAKAFSRRGIPVRILTAEGHVSRHLYPLIEIENLPVGSPIFNYQKLQKFNTACRKFLKAHPTDIVFGLDRTSCSTHMRAGLGVHAAFLKLRKLQEPALKSLSFKCNPLHRTVLRLEKQGFENPNLKLLFTNSHMVKKEVMAYYNTPEEKIQVIHNGVEWKELARPFNDWTLSKNQIANDLNLDPIAYHFLFIGNGYKRKGLDLILKALSPLKDEPLHLSVIGKDKEVKSYIDMADSLGIGSKVSFFGPQTDVTNFYKLSDCLLIPSLYDPNANVTIEALAMGLNVISSKNNGGSEILTPESGMVLNDLHDTQELTDRLRKMCERPKTWISSQNIRATVEHLDFKSQLTKMIDCTLNS